MIKQNIVNITDNFITENEISYIFSMMNKLTFKQSRVGFHEISSTRTSSEVDVSNDEFIQKIAHKIAKHNNISNNYELEANIVRYKKGEYVLLHHDEVDLDENGNLGDIYDDEEEYRVFSAIIFITEKIEGGELCFPMLNVKIKPKSKTLVTFPNTSQTLSGKIVAEPLTVHESTPIEKGEKVVLVLFFSTKFKI